MPAEAGRIEVPETWRQGAILPPDLRPEIERDRVGVVVSHSCDLANPSLETEPRFEWIAATPIDKVENGRIRGRNPRRLDLAGPPPLRLSMEDRRWSPRGTLADFQPSGHLNDEDTAIVSEWMARRYQRSAFPTAFNDRRRPIADKVRKKLASNPGRDLLGLWIALGPYDELPDGESYRGHLMATVTDDLANEAFHAVEALLLDIRDKLAECDGIEIVGEPVVAREGDVTITELKRYTRLDDWDDLSRG
jgi:hypothetical protein